MSDGEKARAERAAKLREEIERLGRERGASPRSPHEFVEERMRERADEAEEEEEEEEEREDPGKDSSSGASD